MTRDFLAADDNLHDPAPPKLRPDGYGNRRVIVSTRTGAYKTALGAKPKQYDDPAPPYDRRRRGPDIKKTADG